MSLFWVSKWVINFKGLSLLRQLTSDIEVHIYNFKHTSTQKTWLWLSETTVIIICQLKHIVMIVMNRLKVHEQPTEPMMMKSY